MSPAYSMMPPMKTLAELRIIQGFRGSFGPVKLSIRFRRSLLQTALVGWASLQFQFQFQFASAQLLEQTIALRAGWNSIALDVEPTNSAPEIVFAGAAIESVWTLQTRASAVQFLSSPSDPEWNRDEWLVHAPAGRP